MQDVERFMKHYFLVAKDVGDLTAILCAKLEDEQVSRAGLEPHGGAAAAGHQRRRVPDSDDFIIDNNRINRSPWASSRRPGQSDPDLPARAEEQPRLPERVRGDALAGLVNAQLRENPEPTGCSWRS